MPHISIFHEPHVLAAKYAAQTPENTEKMINALRKITSNNIGEKNTIENSLLFVVDKSPIHDTFEIKTLLGKNIDENYCSTVPANQPEQIGKKIYELILRIGDTFQAAGKVTTSKSSNVKLSNDDKVVRYFDIIDTMRIK